MMKCDRLAWVSATMAIAIAKPSIGDGQEAVVRDSAGIRIVENGSPGEIPLWTLADTPDVVIGTRVGSTEFALYNVGQPSFLSDGGIVVENALVDLLWFSPQGKLVSRGAGRGDGPSESRTVMRVEVLSGDTVIAVSQIPPSLKVFAPNGRFVRSVPLRLPNTVVTIGRLGSAGWAGLAVGGQFPPGTPGTFRERWFVVRYNADLSTGDTLLALDGNLLYGSRSSYEYVSGGPRMYFAVRNETVVAGESDIYELRVFGPAGELSHIIRNSMANPQELQLVDTEGRTHRARIPLRAPAFDGIVVANDGAVWVRRRTGPDAQSVLATRMLSTSPSPTSGIVWLSKGLAGQEWHVYDQVGKLTARTMLPPGFRPTEIAASRILGVWKDELGVESVRVYRLQKGEGAK